MEAAEHHGRVMASTLHVLAVADGGGSRARADAGPNSPVELGGTIRETVAFLEHLERRWSRFLPDSDISRINQTPVDHRAHVVDPSTLVLLAAMVEGHQCTAGRFDPTRLRDLLDEGYVASRIDPSMVCQQPTSPADPGPAALLALGLDVETNEVTVPAGLALDAGGIGKGLAADLAVGRMIDAGAAGAMVNIGGDLVARGTAVDPSGWVLDVEWPRERDGVMCRLGIGGGGVATSSTVSRRWRRDGVERHHQIDPRTGHSAETDLDAVTVIAPSGWSAEVHATAALGIGSEGVIRYLVGHGLSGIAVPSDGSAVLTTDDLVAVEILEPGRLR